VIAEPRRALIASLQQRIDAALGPHVRAGTPVAVVDFPNHPNAGDSAIWAGEMAYLRSRTVPVAYTCDFRSFAPRTLRARVGDGPVLLHGGGSVGDLWEETQRFRERVVASLPDNPIVQLPQTIHFERPENLERARSAFEAHGGITVLARDEASLEAAAELGAERVLCPDMAFAIGAMERPVRPDHEVLWLSRTDHEARHGGAPEGAPGVRQADWLEQRGIEAPWRALREVTAILGRRIMSRPSLAGVLAGPIARLQEPLANQRVRAGARLLSSGRVVITDRLHGHILSVLLGIPHVLLDNSYGKLRNFRDSWTAGYPLARWAESPEEALRLAADLRAEAPSARA
jgi:pyruvyl transferase EpsO